MILVFEYATGQPTSLVYNIQNGEHDFWYLQNV